MSKFRIRHLYTGLTESIQSALGRRDPFLPPRRLIDTIGGGDFKTVGQEFFRYFTELGKLKPNDRVLDIGCGCGRMAVPLIPFLSNDGSYWGFDIVRSGIDWCQQNIAAKHPRFHFELADVYNKAYNPEGQHRAGRYVFPYADGSFDFVFLTSVFTHMLADDMENYLAQISRVLKSDGRCLITFFLLNAQSRELVRRGASKIDFRYEVPNGATSSLKSPEAAVAFDEAFIRSRFEANRLRLAEPIRYGSWCGRSEFLSYQDITVSQKG